MEVLLHNRAKHLTVINEVLIDQFDFELGAQLLVEYFHRLQCATRQHDTQRLLLLTLDYLLKDEARIEAVDPPLSHVLFLHKAFAALLGTLALVGSNEELEVVKHQLAALVAIGYQTLNFADAL